METIVLSSFAAEGGRAGGGCIGGVACGADGTIASLLSNLRLRTGLSSVVDDVVVLSMNRTD